MQIWNDSVYFIRFAKPNLSIYYAFIILYIMKV